MGLRKNDAYPQYDGDKYKAKYQDVKEYASKLPNKFEDVADNVRQNLASLSTLRLQFKNDKLRELRSIKSDLDKVINKIQSEWGFVYRRPEALSDLESLRKVERDMLSLLASVQAEKLKESMPSNPYVGSSGDGFDVSGSTADEVGAPESDYEFTEKEVSSLNSYEFSADDIFSDDLSTKLINMSRSQFRNEFVSKNWGKNVLMKKSDEEILVDFNAISDGRLYKKLEKDIGLYEILGKDVIDSYIGDREKTLVVVDQKGHEVHVASRDGRRVLDEKGNYIPVWSGYTLKIVRDGSSSDSDNSPNS